VYSHNTTNEYTDIAGNSVSYDDGVADATRRYYYDGWRMLTETAVVAGSESSQHDYVYGNYLDEVLVRMDAGDDPCLVYYYLHDHLFSPVALLDPCGVVVERYEYDAYGRQVIFEPDFSATRSSSSYDNTIAFTGQRLDTLDDGNVVLMYYKNRYYLVHLGRFTSPDPLGVRNVICLVEFGNSGLPRFSKAVALAGQYTDGMSLYEYVQSRPIIQSDDLGLCGVCCECYPPSSKKYRIRAYPLTTLPGAKSPDAWDAKKEIIESCLTVGKWAGLAGGVRGGATGGVWGAACGLIDDRTSSCLSPGGKCIYSIIDALHDAVRREWFDLWIRFEWDECVPCYTPGWMTLWWYSRLAGKWKGHIFDYKCDGPDATGGNSNEIRDYWTGQGNTAEEVCKELSECYKRASVAFARQ